VAFVYQVLDLQSAERYAFTRLADMGDSFGDSFSPDGGDWFLLRQGFESSGDDFLGRSVSACAEVCLNYLFVMPVEGQSKGHD
jgi:hypothetical protein